MALSPTGKILILEVVFEMECKKNNIKATIKGAGKASYIFLLVLFAGSVILGGMQLFAQFWSLMGWSGESVEIIQRLPHDRDIIVRYLTIPDFFYVGETNVFLFAIRDMGGAGIQASFRTVFYIITMFMAMRMFNLLGKGEAPFSKGVTRWFGLFAVSFFIWNIGTNLAMSMVSIVLIAVSFVFSYGHLLQEESDTTL